jgi:zinc transport system substrate-binding protein
MFAVVFAWVAAFALQDGATKPVVTTTFYPTEYLVQRLAGDAVRVHCPVPADADPAFWKPTRDQVLEIQKSALIVVNGAGFEKWVDHANLPLSKTVYASFGFRDEYIVIEHAVTHSHGGEGEHSHEGIDGHTWVDPTNASRQAEAIAKGLTRLLPDEAAAIATRLEAIKADLKQLEDEFRALGALPAGSHLYASHPAYNYLARRCGWPIVSLDFDPEEMPSDEAIAALKESLKTKPATHLLWEAEPKPEIAARLEKDCGLKSVTVSPCETLSAERRAAGEDYLSVMRANVKALKVAFPAE